MILGIRPWHDFGYPASSMSMIVTVSGRSYRVHSEAELSELLLALNTMQRLAA